MMMMMTMTIKMIIIRILVMAIVIRKHGTNRRSTINIDRHGWRRSVAECVHVDVG